MKKEGRNQVKPTLQEIDRQRVCIENNVYGILCEYMPQHENRGYNFHQAAQYIAAQVGRDFVTWVTQSLAGDGRDVSK